MNDITLKTEELEWHQLECRYQSLRFHTDNAIKKLMINIHDHGLLTPIIVIPSGSAEKSWIVIDGYLRIAVFKALNLDKIKVTIWAISVPEALLRAYQHNTSRPWDKLEEANLIQELITLHNCSQEHVAKRLGKSPAWVCHRLKLLSEMPDFVKEAIYKGTLSSWTGSRVIAGFARANPMHTKHLIDYLQSHTHGTRDIQSFYEHYSDATTKTKNEMADNPSIFFKALKLSKQEERTPTHKLPPEQVWGSKLSQLFSCMKVMSSIQGAVFYPQQNLLEQHDLIERLNKFVSKISLLHTTIRRKIDAQTTHDTNGKAPVREGEKPTGD